MVGGEGESNTMLIWFNIWWVLKKKKEGDLSFSLVYLLFYIYVIKVNMCNYIICKILGYNSIDFVK